MIKKIPKKQTLREKFSLHCLAFPENGFNFVTQKFAKNLKNALFKRSEHSFLSSRCLQHYFVRNFQWSDFDLNTLPHSQTKWFQLRQSKISKKPRNAIFKRPQYWLLNSRNLQTHFLRSFLWPYFDLNSFWCFVSLSHKMISTSSIKNFKKLKISLSKCKEHSLLISRSLQNHFLKSFLWPTLNLHCLEGSVSFSQKTVSTSSLKTVQKTENALFKHSEYLFLSSS